MSKQVTLMTDAIPYQEFAKLIGKSTGAVRRMIDKGKLPVIDMTDPQSASGRAGEYWVYLPAWNNGLKLAYETGACRVDDAPALKPPHEAGGRGGESTARWRWC